MSRHRGQPAEPRRCPGYGCSRFLAPAEYLCHVCEHRMAGNLRQLADLAEEAITTVSRLDRHGTGGSRSSEISLPVNLSASSRITDIGVTVYSTARWIASRRGIPLDIERAPLQQAALWLVGQLHWLRHHPEGPVRFDELGRACSSLRRLVDSPPSRRYLGECGAPRGDDVAWPCPGDVYAYEGAQYGHCRLCRARHDVATRRQWLDGLVRGTNATASDIGSAYSIPPSTIRRWAHEGRIVAHGYDIPGRPCYSVAEVLDLAAAMAARRAEQQAKRARRQPSERMPV